MFILYKNERFEESICLIILFGNYKRSPCNHSGIGACKQCEGSAFDMWAQAASVRVKSLDKKRSLIQKEYFILKSELIARDSMRKNAP
jgi:hypothetical protein